MILAVSLLAAAAGYSQGLTGFGFALVFTPIASLLLPPRDVVLSALIVGGITGLLVVFETLRSLLFRGASPMLVSGAVGAPIGVLMLAVIDVRALRVALAVTTLGLAAAMFLVRWKPLRQESLALTAVGFLGGVLNGCTSMGGPPAALVVANQRWGVAESRASLAMFNLLTLAIGLVVASVLGILHSGSWLAAAVATPPAIAGTAAGTLSARRVSAALFRNILVGIIAATAIVMLLVTLTQR